MKAKYDTIGTNYDLTRKADPYLTEHILHLLQPKKEGLYLDIGCGSGNYTHEFQKRGFQYIGIDPSTTMLEKAKQRNTYVDWKIGTAEKTGLPNQSVQGITAFLTIHHWTDITKAMTELSRVLDTQGSIVIFTSTPKQMQRYWLRHYFPTMLSDSIAQMPSLESIVGALEISGIKLLTREPYFIQPDLQDHFLYCGKYNPEVYFNQQVRSGISSFSSLAHKDEVKQGLQLLRQDIDSRQIHKVMKSYQNDLGDYIFIVGKKKVLTNQL